MFTRWKDVDLPYSILVERMQQGAAILNARGDIIYCNPSLAHLLDRPHETVIGVPLQHFLDPIDRGLVPALLSETQVGSSEGEMRVRRADGAVIPSQFFLQVVVARQVDNGCSDNRSNGAEATRRIRVTPAKDARRRAQASCPRVARQRRSIARGYKNEYLRVRQESHKLSTEAAKLVSENAAMIDEIGNEIRTVSHLLHPPLLERWAFLLPSGGMSRVSHKEAKSRQLSTYLKI